MKRAYKNRSPTSYIAFNGLFNYALILKHLYKKRNTYLTNDLKNQHRITLTKVERGVDMPETLAGRELINKYLDDHNISVTSLATMLGETTQYVSQVLSGKQRNPAANEMILQIIELLKIRRTK